MRQGASVPGSPGAPGGAGRGGGASPGDRQRIEGAVNLLVAARKRAGREPQGGRPGQHRADRLGRQAVEQRVLGGPHRQRRRPLRQQRGVPEHLALGQHVHDPISVKQFDGAASHHPGHARRGHGLLEHHGSGLGELDLAGRGHLVQLLLAERVEGRVVAQKFRDLVHMENDPKVREP